MGLYKEEIVRRNPALRWTGIVLLLTAMLFLALDCYLMVTIPGKTHHFTALKNVLAFFGVPSLIELKHSVFAFIPRTVIDNVLIPFTEWPIVFLGIPGVLITRRYAPPIKVRPPTPLEMEMLEMGVDPRRRHRQRVR